MQSLHRGEQVTQFAAVELGKYPEPHTQALEAFTAAFAQQEPHSVEEPEQVLHMVAQGEQFAGVGFGK